MKCSITIRKSMVSEIDERGFNQGFKTTPTTIFRTERRAKALINEIKDGSVKILEIGCGNGEKSILISKLRPRSTVFAIDLSEKFISACSEKNKQSNLHFFAKSFQDFQSSEKFDYIVGDGILHHLYDDLDSSIEAFYELLVPGGKIMFWEPNIFNPYIFLIFHIKILRKLAKLEPDEMCFTSRFIKRKLGKKFSLAKVEFKDFLIPITPYSLIKILIYCEKIIEKTPLRFFSQSVFITAEKKI